MDIHENIRDFTSKLEEYLHAKSPGYYGRVETRTGRKFVKIIYNYAGSCGGVYCFIDLSNGDILKAADRNTPAKGKRGSIFNENCDVGDGKPCDQFGGGLYKQAA